MNTLAQQKQQIDTLEAKCNMLKNFVLNLSKSSHLVALNYRMSTQCFHLEFKENNMIHLLHANMDIGNQESHPTNLGLEDANCGHAFHLILCYAKSS